MFAEQIRLEKERYEQASIEAGERFRANSERWQREKAARDKRYKRTNAGLIDMETGENLDEHIRPVGFVVKTCLYKCGDTGMYKRVSLYDYSRPPERLSDDTDLMSTADFMRGLGGSERAPIDRDTLEWWLGGVPVSGPGPGPQRCADERKDRFRQSLSRARGMVQQYAECNHWSYFVTLTLDGRKQDRQNLGLFLPKFKQFLKDVQRDVGERPQYVTVPELHRDGVSWHLHGLMNIPASELVEITDVYRVLRNGHYQWHMQDGYPIGYDVARKFLIGNGNRLFSWCRYERRFGFCTVEAVKSQQAASAYCSKMFRYIAETMSDTDEKTGKSRTKKHKAAWKVLAAGKHLYYCSRGLKKYEKVAEAEQADVLASAGLVAGKLYTYKHCEIQFYYIGENENVKRENQSGTGSGTSDV